MTLSTYAGNATLNLWFRGVAPSTPTEVWMSMHTADPGLTGASEVSTGAWPAYERVAPAQGGAVGTGFSAASNKQIANAKDILFPRHDGETTVTVSYVGFWDAQSGGNFIGKGVVVDSEGDPASKTFAPDDEAMFYTGEITVVID